MREIRKVVILGANGTMGSGAGGLFAARGYDVVMLARDVDKAQRGLERAKEAVRADVLASRIRCGSYGEDLEREVGSADLIFEAVSEDLTVKTPYLERVDKARPHGSIVATVSSGLSISAMTQGRTDDFRKHFLGMHLFNPPHVIVGTELIAGPETDKVAFKSISSLLTKRLGRVVIECRDMPAFAGNRVGFKVLNECAQLAQEYGVAFIDYLIGPYTGRAMSPLATIDLVGWDVHKAIVDNVYANTKDEAHSAFELPKYMQELMDKGHMGNKTPAKGGFVHNSVDQNGKKTGSVLDPQSRRYVDVKAQPKLGFVEDICQLHAVGLYSKALSLFLSAKGSEAHLARKVILGYVSYGLNRVGPTEVVDAPLGVDLIMGYGFNWAPPSVLVDIMGKKPTIAAMQACGLKVPQVLSELRDGERLYAQSNANVGRYFVGK